MKRPLSLVLLLVATGASAQKYQGLALTPPMGWNSWNHFGCDIDERTVKETADAMVASGMRDAGYRYINIDDCWHGERDASGAIQPDSARFPSGMKALADYVHARGLRLGLYSDAGWRTCAGRPGSRGHEFQDARSYAAWGIDYLKYDWCNTDGLNARGAYQTMSAALKAAGRPMVLSVCEWGDNRPWEWAEPLGHLWRTTGDITACFDCVVDHGTWKSWGILQILDKQEGLRVHAGPDRWNDPDMLEVGNGMSEAEDRSHFSMWSMLAAPLIAGNDLRSMDAATRATLTNREVIAVDQDSLGVQAFPHRSANGVQIWVRPLSGNAWAMALLNRTGEPRSVTFDFASEDVSDGHSGREARFRSVEYQIRDLWGHRDAATTHRPLSANLLPHDVLMVRLTPVR
jgi:alpha-galactosidase